MPVTTTKPRASESGIRTRRSELVKRGMIVDTGKRVTLDSGRQAKVWAIVPGHPDVQRILATRPAR